MWQRNSTGFSSGVPAARSLTTRFCLRGSGPNSSTSSAAKPASIRRFRIAAVASVTLPRSVSVVLISISSFKMERASARSSGEVAGIGLWADNEVLKQTAITAMASRGESSVRTMHSLYGCIPCVPIPHSLS